MKTYAAAITYILYGVEAPTALAKKPILRGPSLVESDEESGAMSLIMAQMKNMQAKITKLEANQAKVSKCFDVEHLEDGSMAAVIRDGCALRTAHGDHVIHGSVTTHGHHTVHGGNIYVHDGSGSSTCAERSSDSALPKCSGKGNIFVGHAPGHEATIHRDVSGSHNIILGTKHAVLSHGSIVSGFNHTVVAAHATALGGQNNTAASPGSLALGGSSNVAGQVGLGDSVAAVVLGGLTNSATGIYSTVTGGSRNKAEGGGSSVTGGRGNKAEGIGSSVTGGADNTAQGENSHVSGGGNNRAEGDSSSVTGGRYNKAVGYFELAPRGDGYYSAPPLGDNSNTGAGTSDTDAYPDGASDAGRLDTALAV